MEGTLGGGVGSWNVREAGFSLVSRTFQPFVVCPQSDIVLCWRIASSLPASLPLTVKLFIAIVCSHTRTHTGMHSRTQTQLGWDDYWYKSTLRAQYIIYWLSPETLFLSPNPSSLLSFLLLSLYCHGHQEKRKKKIHTSTHTYSKLRCGSAYAFFIFFGTPLCSSSHFKS